MRFLIVGAGGVGGYFGAKLSAGGEDVRFVARGKHLAAIRSRGLSVNSTTEHLHVGAERFSDNVDDAGTADVVLFCVKSYDTEDAARLTIPCSQTIPSSSACKTASTTKRRSGESFQRESSSAVLRTSIQP